MADRGAHRNTAEAGRFAPALLRAAVGWTLVNSQGWIVLPQVPARNESDVRGVAVVVHASTHPPVRRVGISIIPEHKPPIVVVRIHQPGELQLFEIAQTLDTLRFGLRFA